MGSIDLSKFKIYVDGTCITDKFKRLYNFVPRGDKVVLEYINKIKWLKTSEVL